jgi:hypothetical protein
MGKTPMSRKEGNHVGKREKFGKDGGARDKRR